MNPSHKPISRSIRTTIMIITMNILIGGHGGFIRKRTQKRPPSVKFTVSLSYLLWTSRMKYCIVSVKKNRTGSKHKTNRQTNKTSLHPRWGIADAEIKDPQPAVGAQGFQSLQQARMNVALHAAPADRASSYPVAAFLIHSTSFSPNVSDPQQWNVL